MRGWIKDERGLSMMLVLATSVILASVVASMIALMNTDLTHASVQHALSASYYGAQAGLEQARAQFFQTGGDPLSYVTTAAGVRGTLPNTNAQYTYWVDAGPALTNPCPAGMKTVEALGEAYYVGRTINSRIRACGVPGTPSLTALWGVSRVELEGSTYVAPYRSGVPGAPRGGNVGSFTEINISDPGPHLNSLSGTLPSDLHEGIPGEGVPSNAWTLFGWPSLPSYNPNDALPANIFAFGDIVKGQPNTGPIANPCGTLITNPFACVTIHNRTTDVQSIADLRTGGPWGPAASDVYMNSMFQQVLPVVCSGFTTSLCDPSVQYTRASSNTANDLLNTRAGVPFGGSVYPPAKFDLIVAHLAAGCPGGPSPCVLRGPVYVDGTYRFRPDLCPQCQDVSLGGPAGDVTLAVRGDMILETGVTVRNLHDLRTTAGRQTPGFLVYGLAVPDRRLANICSGDRANGSGQIILCGGSSQRLVADGLIYSADGMSVNPGATVDLIGAMYHQHRDPSIASASYSAQNATVVIRFDALSLRAIGRGIALVSWRQLK